VGLAVERPEGEEAGRGPGCEAGQSEQAQQQEERGDHQAVQGRLDQVQQRQPSERIADDLVDEVMPERVQVAAGHVVTHDVPQLLWPEGRQPDQPAAVVGIETEAGDAGAEYGQSHNPQDAGRQPVFAGKSSTTHRAPGEESRSGRSRGAPAARCA